MRHVFWLTVVLLGGAVLLSQTAPSANEYSRRQAVLDEIVWPSHEPLMFLRRHGGADVAAENDYFRYHTEENVRKIASTGLEMSRILHFYKGFGLAAEAEEMGRTVELARLFHKYGMKVPVYIGGTMFTETFFQETPEARHWIRVDQQGQPVTYGGLQTARYFACFNQPGYVEYMKKVLRKAVLEVKADRIFFDNFTLYPEPQSCHNDACKREFRRWLERKYDARTRTRRFGFADMAGIEPPIWNLGNEPWQLDTIDDPLFQEWVDFRCWTITHYYRQLYDYIKSLNPAVSVGVNIKGILGRNRAFRDGIDHARLAEVGDWFELDPGFPAGISRSGALVSEIRSYKAGQSLRTPFDFEASSPLRMAEYMAFNYQKETPGFGWNGGFREFIWAPHVFAYFDFFKQNDSRYYRGARSLADVAILRGYASMANNNWSVHRATILGEQVLIQNRLPFHIVFDRNLEELPNYRVLFLTDQECLSDADLGRIKEFVANGGGVVATGTTGAFDAWRRRRPQNGLAAALGFRTGQAVRGSFGKGRYVYLPAIVPVSGSRQGGSAIVGDDGVGTPRDYRDFSPDSWLPPSNSPEILDALRWAADGPFTSEIQAPLNVVAEVTRDATGAQRMVHLLNYDTGHVAQHIRVDLAVASPVRSVTVLSPDSNVSGPVAFQQRNGRLLFEVERLETYDLAVIATGR